MDQKAFTFNFLSENTQKTASSCSNGDAATAPKPSLEQSASRQFHWVENLEALLAERSQEELIYKDIPIGTSQPIETETIRMVDLNLSSYRKVSEKEGDHQQQDKNEESDIISGVYEGGRKVWECSLDLVEYLSISMDTNQDESNATVLPSRIWEIGCGHGLPGCYLLHKWIVQKRRSDEWSLVFSDFNEEVILDATISNIVLNSRIGLPASDGDETLIQVEDVGSHVKLGSGDWNDQSRQMLEADTGSSRKFDLILAAETLYTETASKDTAELLRRHLDPTNGVAFIGTKRYYFGVGGGVDCFRAHATGLSIESVRVIDNGTGNIREVLKIRVE